MSRPVHRRTSVETLTLSRERTHGQRVAPVAPRVNYELLGACEDALEHLSSQPPTQKTRRLCAQLRYAINQARGGEAS